MSYMRFYKKIESTIEYTIDVEEVKPLLKSPEAPKIKTRTISNDQKKLFKPAQYSQVPDELEQHIKQEPKNLKPVARYGLNGCSE